MFDSSGVSLSTSDPNPSIDQFDDGGDSTDWGAVVSTAGQWGAEIAAIVNNRAPAAYPNGGSGGPYPSYVPGIAPPTPPATKILLLVLLAGGGWLLIRSFNN